MVFLAQYLWIQSSMHMWRCVSHGACMMKIYEVTGYVEFSYALFGIWHKTVRSEIPAKTRRRPRVKGT